MSASVSTNILKRNRHLVRASGKASTPGRLGRPTSPATVWRWCAKGVRALSGKLVKLESCSDRGEVHNFH